MKTLKLLNKKYFFLGLIFFSIFFFKSYSNEPVDIWNLEKKNIEQKTISENVEEESTIIETSINTQSLKKTDSNVAQEQRLVSKKNEIIGIYDPEENDLNMDMWSNSDGKKIINLFNKIKKIKLSNDAKELLNISLLTNSYFPKLNISAEEFHKLKFEWLIKNNDLKLIENFLIKNQNVYQNHIIIKYLVNQHLAKARIKKSCEIFSKLDQPFNDDYLFKFNIYCLVDDGKKDEAQLLLDLKKELGFNDDYFEKKFNYLMGYEESLENSVSENSILDFHLAHRTNTDFNYEPKTSTSKIIWTYLSSASLLDSIKNIDIEDKEKLALIEKATHDRNYSEKELFDLYKKFQFNINQLLSVKDSYKVLPSTEARALVYQGILITTNPGPKLELMQILKNLFIKDGIKNAFNNELASILKDIKLSDVPSNLTSFYSKFLIKETEKLKKTKINNKIIHQSKLLNHFAFDLDNSKIEKDLNDILKKIKKDKNYSISTKDIILLESLKSDGININKKYDNLYQSDVLNMPNDIQSLIDNDEVGLVLMRLVEVIGADELKNIESETIYFIISALNQLNIDHIRNEILLKVLPLKV